MMRSARGQTFLLLFASGALLPLALAPFNFWPIAIPCIALLFYKLQHQTIKQAVVKAGVFAFAMFFSGVSWVYVSIHEHGFIPAPLALLATALFCLFLALLFALPFAIAALIPQTSVSWLLGLPAIWVLSEWFRSWIFTGFPWLYAGYIHTDTWFSGWAPIGGVMWLSFITALAAATLAQLGSQLLEKKPSIQLGVKLSCSVLALLSVSGYLLQSANWTQETGKILSVVLVQPNTDQNIKWSTSERQGILEQLQEQSEPHWGADLIIWPEAAIPATPTRVSDFLIGIDKTAEVNQTALLTGIPTQDWSSGKYYNSVLALGTAKGQYDKTRLVPFGEYVPLEGVLRGLIRFFNLPMSSFSLGAKDQALLEIAGEPMATAICYEIVYPDLVARVSREATMILTVSNDAWFGDSFAPQQHMQMARMRAIENAKPMLRGTSNGVTAIVDHRGKIERQLEQFSAGELSGNITPRVGQTLFAQTGSWPAVIMALLICAGLIIRRLLKQQSSRH
ncbi:Apolipoprotein N-acyltransferase [Gammaproteobacteria bacterium MOLA455]|nr:Apolipoprotein N-acyltransferase [Gammaproteobacteria bacterium MOLA455]